MINRFTPVDAHRRRRNYLSEPEVKRLADAAAKVGRNSRRNRLIVWLMFRHGLRVSEACALRIGDVDLDTARIWINRIKNGLSTAQPIHGNELRLLRSYLRVRKSNLPWLFVSERLTPMSRHAVYSLIRNAANMCGFDGVNVTPHTLRHSCGFALAERNNDSRVIQDYLGHQSPVSTARYTRTSVRRFAEVWR